MKIGIIFDGIEIPPKSGVAFRLYYLSKKLEEKGVRVVMFLCERGWVSHNDLKKEPFVFHIFSPEVFYKKIDFVKNVISKEKPDIIQVNNSSSVLSYGAYYSNELRIPLVTEMHDCDAIIKKTLGCDRQDIDISEFIQYSAGYLSHEVICMTPKDKKEFIHMGILKDKINLIPNGIDTDYFKYNSPNLPKRQIIFLGNMFYEPNRNAAEIAIKMIVPHINARLLCIGMVEDSFRRKFSSDKVVFTGGVDDIRPFLKESSIAIAPVFEGSGMKVKLLNYAASGLPIVSTEMGISGYPRNIAIIENDITKYPKLVEKLLDDLKVATEQSKKAREIVCKKFSFDFIAEKVIKLYKKTKFKKKRSSFVLGVKDKEKKNKIFFQRLSPLPMWLEEKRVKFSSTVPDYITLNYENRN
ncbi:MAG: glycosyltransferase family 4 protein [bacterium]|nr:glycosyltransferase family 4 protein [bacterium]